LTAALQLTRSWSLRAAASGPARGPTDIRLPRGRDRRPRRARISTGGRPIAP